LRVTSSRQASDAAWPTILVSLLVFGQLALGIGTYVVKYSWPAWLGDYQFAAAHVVQEKSLVQALVTTAHVANGSLILFVAVFGATRLTRVFAWPPASVRTKAPDSAVNFSRREALA
jgi:hypothetical protein